MSQTRGTRIELAARPGVDGPHARRRTSAPRGGCRAVSALP